MHIRIAISLALLICACGAQTANSGFHEELIAQASPEAELERSIIGDKHIAWVEKRNGKRTVHLDGTQQGGSFDEVKHLTLAAHESHVAFFGKRDSEWIFVLDGQEHAQRYKNTTAVEFQPGGSSYAYCACQGKTCRLTVDGTATGPEYEDVSYPQYSLDGKRLAFFGKRQKRWIAIIDGKEFGPELEDFWASAWGFTHKGNFLVAGYSGGRKGGWSYVVDGVAGPQFDVLSPISFSGDAHYAYAGATSKSGFKKDKPLGTIVLDGKALDPTYEGRGFGGAAVSIFGGVTETMLGGVRDLDADFHGVSSPQFSPDGKLSYAARRGDGNVVVFIDGKSGPAFDGVSDFLIFGDDASHYAYVARSGEEFITVLDGHSGAHFAPGKRGATQVGWIALKDKDHVAFESVSGGRVFKAGETARALRTVVLDGGALKEYDAFNISYFEFGNAGHYSFVVRGASGNNDLINIDGHESRLYSDVLRTHAAEEGKSATYVARDGNRFFRVTYSPASAPPSGAATAVITPTN